MRTDLSILHYASLGQVGGVERYLTGFLGHRSQRYRVRHGVELFERECPAFREPLRRHAAGVYYPKHVGPIKIPRWPRGLREGYRRRVARQYAPGVGLIWNLLGDLKALERARAGGLTVVYWERGLGWFADQGEEKTRAFLKGIDAALANSHAGARILELGWDYVGPLTVCRNALRADAAPPRSHPRTAPADRPWRLGTCGRLVPFKGHSLALHALARLLREGVDAELEIAGTGPLEEELAALIERLGLSGRARLLGELTDTEPFFECLDLLLHPALREPCANVVPEALAHGTPVVAGAVDGMPELIEEGRTGRVLSPTLPLVDYQEFGAHRGRMPLFVYDPATDTLIEPRLVDPEALAGAVRGYVDDPERYAATSAAALDAAREHFEPTRRLEEVLDVLHGYAHGEARPKEATPVR